MAERSLRPGQEPEIVNSVLGERPDGYSRVIQKESWGFSNQFVSLDDYVGAYSAGDRRARRRPDGARTDSCRLRGGSGLASSHRGDVCGGSDGSVE